MNRYKFTKASNEFVYQMLYKLSPGHLEPIRYKSELASNVFVYQR